MSLGVGLIPTAGASPRVEQMPIAGRDTTVTFASDVEPVSVVLDPGVWVLAEFGPFTRTPAPPPRR
jgi:hypothetical protein